MDELPPDIESLRSLVDDLQRKAEVLGMENEMLQDFLQRNRAEKGDMDSDSIDDVGSPARRQGRGQRHVRMPTSLALEEKYRIANCEVEALGKDIDQTKKTAEQNFDLLHALMEETDIRTAEVKRDAYEFRRDIVVGAENPRTGKTMAEKVLKYMEDKLTQKDMLINKLLMKNQAYKIAISKAQKQFKSKQDHDDLQYIDFHQLQIENQQFVVKIEEANQELLKLKRTSGRTVKKLNTMKKKLNLLMADAKFIRDDISERKQMLAKTESDIIKVVEEKDNARKDNKKLRVQSRISPEMPQVMDYVNQKAEEYEFDLQLRNWKRKVEIVQLAANRYKVQQKYRNAA